MGLQGGIGSYLRSVSECSQTAAAVRVRLDGAILEADKGSIKEQALE